jgi:hypothetical protein
MARTEQELQDAAGHVDYEIQMLRAMVLWLSSHSSAPQAGWGVWNACLESFVVHVRNLIDFLYPPTNPRRDDVLSDHYVSDIGEWQRQRPPKNQLLEDAKKRVNKMAAHLVYARANLDKNWKFAEIWTELQQVIKCFVDRLPPDRVAWFPNAGPQGPVGPPTPTDGVGATGPGPTGSANATKCE